MAILRGKRLGPVFTINQGMGEPTLIQNVDTPGDSRACVHLDPSGRILVAGNMMHGKEGVRVVPASLVVSRRMNEGWVNATTDPKGSS